jgi:hypothetical protein
MSVLEKWASLMRRGLYELLFTGARVPNRHFGPKSRSASPSDTCPTLRLRVFLNLRRFQQPTFPPRFWDQKALIRLKQFEGELDEILGCGRSKNRRINKFSGRRLRSFASPNSLPLALVYSELFPIDAGIVQPPSFPTFRVRPEVNWYLQVLQLSWWKSPLKQAAQFYSDQIGSSGGEVFLENTQYSSKRTRICTSRENPNQSQELGRNTELTKFCAIDGRRL